MPNSSWYNDAAKATEGVSVAMQTVETVQKVANSPIVEGLGAFGKWIGKVSTIKTREETEKLKSKSHRIAKNMGYLKDKQKDDVERELRSIEVIKRENKKKETDAQIKTIAISSVVLLVGIGVAVLISRRVKAQ